jgi:hypothetical protein
VSYQKERDEFIAQYVKAGGNVLDARCILRNAETVQRFAVEACNRELSKSEILRDENAQARILATCAEAEIAVDFSGDPRGYVVKLHFPSGAYNTWGGKEAGYGVPTRP